MRISISKDATSGNTLIPAADYWVSLNASGGEITLSAGGKDIRIKAVRRRSKARTKSTTVAFYAAGGRLWSLVVTTPKMGEWVSFIEYAK